MCNTCNIARRTYNQAIVAPWEEYQRIINHLLELYGNSSNPDYLNELAPHIKKYQEAANGIGGPYLNAIRQCKDTIR